MKKIAYFLSHPIQYQTPLFQKFDKIKAIDFEVIYFTDHTLGGLDRQFGINISWDIPLLEGYKYQFLKNHARNPAVSGKFLGLINWGLIKYLIQSKPDIVVLHGWGYFSNILLLITANILNIKIIMRAESPLKQEIGKSKINHLFKKIILKLCNKFLYIGKENKAFFKSFGIKEKQLFYAPYCVDNSRFSKDISKFDKKNDDVRILLKIPEHFRIGLFCGKFINKKRPKDILEAFNKTQPKNLAIIFVGTGQLERELKAYVSNQKLENIFFVGFVNQTELYKYYMSADFFILPSGYGETWGLVVNEAMNYALPLLISDQVGSTADLVQEGINGYTYPCGDIAQLAKEFNTFSTLSDEGYRKLGKESYRIVKNYSFDEIMTGFKQAIK
jgi:glycosyltransferase involved in cell wall biosynthesis